MSDIENNRMTKQVEFLLELDKLKQIERRSRITNGERRENSAEHSWHICMYAWLFNEYTEHNSNLDIFKAIKMLLIHDIVEIDAGDTIVYDLEARQAKEKLEEIAAERIFGLLPKDQAEELHELWRDFEEGASIEAQFAKGIDRVQPILQNFANQGGSWKEHNIKPSQVKEINQHIEKASPQLWRFVNNIIDEAEKRGFFNSDTLNY